MIGAGSYGASPLPSRPDLTQRLNYKSFILPLARQGRKGREHMAMETVWMGGIECMHAQRRRQARSWADIRHTWLIGPVSLKIALLLF